MNKFLIVFFIICFLKACGTVSEGFKLKKGNTGDEFLVEKKNPLVLPPDYTKLPEPGNTEVTKQTEGDTFKLEISKKNNSKDKNNSVTNSNSTEEFILKNIKKNEFN